MGDDRTPSVTTDYRYAPIPETLLYSSMSDKAVRVYGTLMRHGLDPSHCYPSHMRIATLIGCGKRSIQRPLRELEDAGWVERVPRFLESGDRTSDGYRVRTDLGTPSAPTAQESAYPPRGGARTVRAEERAKREQENQSKENENRAVVVYSDDFEAFWTAYPRKAAKDVAAKAFEKAVTRTTLEDMAAGLRRWCTYWSLRGEPEYIPHPATWLNQNRWNDMPPAVTRSTKPGGNHAEDAINEFDRNYMGEAL